MQKEINQIRNFSRALSVICTIALVIMFIGALGLFIAIFMSGNSEFLALLEQSGYDALLGGYMEILPLYIVYALLSAILYIVVLFMLRKVLRGINALEIFNAENAKRLDAIAYILIIGAFVLPLVLTISSLAVLGTLTYNLSLTDIVLGLALLLVSRILLYGHAQQSALAEAQQEIKKRYEDGSISADDVFKEN